MSIEQIYKSATPFEWVSQHIQLVGWPLVVLAAWKVRGIAAKWNNRIVAAEHHITKMATNEMPHMQRALMNIDKNIAKMSGGDEADFSDLE